MRKEFKLTKKMIVGCLAAIMCGSALSGCGGGEQITHEDISKVPEDTYEIKWFMLGDPQKDVEAVEEKINEYLKDKINATVDMTIMAPDQYNSKVTNMINAGEEFDMCYVSSGTISYPSYAKAGAFYPLNDFLDNELKDIAEEIHPVLLQSPKIDDVIYALPVYKEFSSTKGWIYRKDIAEKYNIDMSKYKTFRDIMPVIEMIQKNEPNMKYPMDWNSSETPVSETEPIRWEAFGVAKFGDGEFGILPEAPEFQEACRIAREYYTKGLVRKDVNIATDIMARAKDGNTFCFYYTLKPGKANELFANSEYEWAQIDCSPNIMEVSPGMGSLQAISATSKNPARVARFMNLLNTDKTLKNLVIFGVEGKHYKKIGDNHIEIIPGGGYDMSSYSWSIGNVYLDYTKKGEDLDKYVQLKAFSDSAIPNTNPVFDLNMENIENEIAAMQAVKSEFGRQLNSGAMDPEPLFKTFAEKLKAAGAEKVRDEIAKQYYAAAEKQK